MIKYEADTSWLKISKVEVERETKNSVWINGRRNAKLSGWKSYFDTFQEAKEYLIQAKNEDVFRARCALNRANAALGNAEGLKED